MEILERMKRTWLYEMHTIPSGSHTRNYEYQTRSGTDSTFTPYPSSEYELPSSSMNAKNPSTRQEFHPTDPGTQVILHNPDRCTGCRQCMTACSFKNFFTYNYDLSLCKVITGPKGEFIRIHCHHCADPMCMAACPTEAIRKDPSTGIVSVDKMRCIGCKACIWACPLAIPQMQRGLKAMTKCDLCGGDPSCIKVCSAKAIQLVSRCDNRLSYGDDTHE